MSSSSVPPFSYAPLVYTQPPNPDWKYGEPVTTTEQGREWMKGLENGGLKTLDVSEESSRCVPFLSVYNYGGSLLATA